MKQTQIEKITYFGDNEQTMEQGFNSNVLYYKNNKLYNARYYVDFFNRSIYFPKNQPKGFKVLVGLQELLQAHHNFNI